MKTEGIFVDKKGRLRKYAYKCLICKTLIPMKDRRLHLIQQHGIKVKIGSTTDRWRVNKHFRRYEI